MAQDAQARLLIIAQVKDLLTAQMLAMGHTVEEVDAHVAGLDESFARLSQAHRLLDALQGSTTSSTLGLGKGLTELAGSAREANQALDAFGDYEALVAAEADGGVRSVTAFVAALEAAGAEVARIKAVGPPSFKIGAATAGTQDEQLARQFAAAKTIFGRDLARELQQQQEWIRAQEVLDPALRKTLQDEVDLAAAIRQATVEEKASVEAFVAGEESKRAVLARFNATLRAGEDARQGQAIAQMEATAANAFTSALQRGAQAEATFTAAIKDATAAETAQLTRTSELAQSLRGSAWQAAIENTTRLDEATRALGSDYVKAAQSAQRFFEFATTRRGLAPPVAAAQAQGQFEGDLAAFRNAATPNLSGLQAFRAEAKLGAIAMRDFVRDSSLLRPALEGVDQVVGSTASKLIIFFVVLNRIREATTQAIEFSKAMTQVATITDLTAGQVADLGEEVQQLALHFGTKELDVAKGLYLTLSSGIENTADALKLVTAANELAVTGFATTEQTIDLLTSTINAYGLTVNDARKLNDLFFTTVRVGKAELPELAHNLGAVLPVAAQMGISLEELLAAVAALTLGGQNADEAVTSLRQILADFVNPSTDAAQVLTELQARTTQLGDSTLGAAIKSKGLLAVMKALNETVGDNSARLRELVPNQRGFVALAALSGNQLQAFERTLNATTNAAGTNAAALEKVFVSQGKQIEIVQAGIRQGFLDVGQAIIEGFAPLDGTADSARNTAEQIKSAISSIGPVAQEAARFINLVGSELLAVRASVAQYKADLLAIQAAGKNQDKDTSLGRTAFGKPSADELEKAAQVAQRAAGEALRARYDLDAAMNGGEAYKQLAVEIEKAKKNVDSFAQANIAAAQRIEGAAAQIRAIRQAYLAQGFTEGTGGGAQGKDVDYFMGIDERVKALRKSIDDAKAQITSGKSSVEYWLGLEGGGTFEQAIDRAKEHVKNLGSIAASIQRTTLSAISGISTETLASMEEQRKMIADLAAMQGQIERGNIDLFKRPHHKNEDGSISTVRSASFEENGRTILVPTVDEQGRLMSMIEAIDNYHETNKHLGIFDNEANATAFAKALHLQQAALLEFEESSKRSGKSASDDFDAIDREAAKLEADLKKLKLVGLREEFDSTARIAAAFGSKTEKSLVAAQEKVRTLTREFATFRAELDVRKSKGEFGAPTEAPAEAERAAQLAARTRLFEAQRAQAEAEVATARNAIAVQKLLAQAFSGTDVSMQALTSSASVGSVALAALVEGLKSAAANAPDFSEAVRATNLLKDAREKLKLTDAEQAVVELKAAMAIEDRFNVEVNAGRITGKRAEQIRLLIDQLNNQAEAEVATQKAIAQRSTFATLPGVQGALGGLYLQAAAIAKIVKEGKLEKELKQDLELLDQRRVTTTTEEAQALSENLRVMQARIPILQAFHLLSAEGADDMERRIELIRKTTLAEMELKGAQEDRERFLKTQGFGGGFTQSFEDFTRTVDTSFKQGQIVGQSFFSNLENGFASVVSGATSAKEAFQQFAQALLSDISRLLVRMLLMETIGNSLGSLFGFGGGAGGFGTQNAIGGGDLAGSGSGAGTLFAKGGAFDRRGEVYKFADGDIFDRATRFRFGGGKKGEAGEAGPEAIVPLKRGPQGSLGIQAFGVPQRPQINNFILPRQREVPIEFRTGSARSRDTGSQPINIRLELNVASLDPRTAGDVVLSAMPQIERALAESIRKGSNRTLNENLRAVSGVQ